MIGTGVILARVSLLGALIGMGVTGCGPLDPKIGTINTSGNGQTSVGNASIAQMNANGAGGSTMVSTANVQGFTANGSGGTTRVTNANVSSLNMNSQGGNTTIQTVNARIDVSQVLNGDHYSLYKAQAPLACTSAADCECVLDYKAGMAPTGIIGSLYPNQDYHYGLVAVSADRTSVICADIKTKWIQGGQYNFFIVRRDGTMRAPVFPMDTGNDFASIKAEMGG